MAKHRLSCKEALMKKSGPFSPIAVSQCGYSEVLIISEPQQFPLGFSGICIEEQEWPDGHAEYL